MHKTKPNHIYKGGSKIMPFSDIRAGSVSVSIVQCLYTYQGFS
jgi:hypothetical protein